MGVSFIVLMLRTRLHFVPRDIYVCGVLRARPCNYKGQCVAVCGETIEAGAIGSLATGVPNVVHRFHKSQSEWKHEIDLRLQTISSQSSLSSLILCFSSYLIKL